jgi:chemotaxis signal transduction protein
MKFDFCLLTTFLLGRQDGIQTQIRCLGSREILKIDSDTPRYILGTIEFKSSHIPVVDPGAASGSEPVEIDHSTCILVIKHNYVSRRLHTGIVIQGFEEVEKLAAGIYKTGWELEATENVRFVLEMHNGRELGNEILTDSHRVLSLLDEPEAQKITKQPSGRPGKLFNLIEKLRSLDYSHRHLVLEELASRPELWDKERNVMVL